MIETREHILKAVTDDFFPKDGRWVSSCFRRPQELQMCNLPCHLRDNVWLTELLKNQYEVVLLGVPKKEVLKFVTNSDYFKTKRSEYEQRIVEWQIEWMKSDGENWIASPEYGGDFIFFNSKCDIGFRKGVVDTLSKIGMARDAIEAGLERHASLWRDSMMKLAFTNKYEPFIYDIDFGGFLGIKNINKEVLSEVEPEFRSKWLQLRKYEYYKAHKDSVDKYGIVEDDMKLSDQEAYKLKIYLREMHDKRMQEIENYNRRKEEKHKEMISEMRAEIPQEEKPKEVKKSIKSLFRYKK